MFPWGVKHFKNPFDSDKGLTPLSRIVTTGYRTVYLRSSIDSISLTGSMIVPWIQFLLIMNVRSVSFSNTAKRFVSIESHRIYSAR